MDKSSRKGYNNYSTVNPNGIAKGSIMKEMKTATPYILAALICLFISFPAVSNSIVLDEAYTLWLIRGNVPDIIQGAASDVHPPLYYLLLKLFQIFGSESLFKYRIATALGTYLNLLLIGATLIRKQWGCRVSILYILWFGLTYGTLEKSTFIRMYSWGAFFVTAAAVLLYSYYKSNKKSDFIPGIIMTVAAMYTHYYAVITMFFIWLFLLSAAFIKKDGKIKHVFLGGFTVIIGYLPWLGALVSQSRRVAENYWMPDFDWNEWRMVPAALMETTEASYNGIGMVLYTFLIILLVLALAKKKWDAILCVSAFVCTMVMGALLSVLVTPIWATRYMYLDWGLISLFVAIVAGEVTSAYAKIAQGMLIMVLAITGMVSLNTMLDDETMNNTADQWIAFLEENVEKDAYIIVDDPAEHKPVYDFYLPHAHSVYTETLLGRNIEEELSDFLVQSDGHQIWYIVDYRQQRIGADEIRSYLEKLRYSLEPAGYYVIEQKELEVFRVEEMQYEE